SAACSDCVNDLTMSRVLDSTVPDKSLTNGVQPNPGIVLSHRCWRGPPPSGLGRQATLAGSFCPFGSRVSLRLEVAIARRMAASQQRFTRPLIGTIARPQRHTSALSVGRR